LKARKYYTKVKQIARDLFKANKKCGHLSPYFLIEKHLEKSPHFTY